MVPSAVPFTQGRNILLFLCRILVHEPLTFEAFDGFQRALTVRNLAPVESEIELRQVAVKMMRRPVMIDPMHATFQERVETLACVDVRATPHILAFVMVDRFMSSELILDAEV